MTTQAANTRADSTRLVRENLEGLYIGQERYVEVNGDPRGQAESVAVVTRANCERVIRYAFEYARQSASTTLS